MASEKPGPEPDITYLRRGPRSNELFFVYDRESFSAMVKEFLKRRGGRKSGSRVEVTSRTVGVAVEVQSRLSD